MNETRGLWCGKRVDFNDWIIGHFAGYFLNEHGEKTPRILRDDNGDLEEVIPDTLGECVGLRDKNGKLIFEGDMLCVKSQFDLIGTKPPVEMFLCYYDGEQAGFYAENVRTGSKYMLGALMELTLNRLSVVGNIHDNPELAKGESNERLEAAP